MVSICKWGMWRHDDVTTFDFIEYFKHFNTFATEIKGKPIYSDFTDKRTEALCGSSIFNITMVSRSRH